VLLSELFGKYRVEAFNWVTQEEKFELPSATQYTMTGTMHYVYKFRTQMFILFIPCIKIIFHKKPNLHIQYT